MKKNSLLLMCLFLFILSETEINAQETKGIYDTIHIYGKGNRKKYTVEASKFGYIQLAGYNPDVVRKLAKFGGDLVGESLTSLTGIGFGGTRDVEFVYPGQIITAMPYYDWQMNVYCEGSITTERNRVKNSDGTHSVQTTEKRYYYWDRGTKGIILGMADTIGRLEIIRWPKPDPVLDKWIIDVAQKKREQGDSLFASAWRYVTLCQFRGKETAIWYNYAANEIYILAANELLGVLQIGNLPDRIKRKTPVKFTLLALNSLPENDRIDILRLAMFGLWLKDISQ